MIKGLNERILEICRRLDNHYFLTQELQDRYRKDLAVLLEQRDKYVKALATCRMTGAVKAATTLLDLITADSSGDDGALMREAIEGITHTTLTTRDELNKKKNGYGNNSKQNSPIG